MKLAAPLLRKELVESAGHGRTYGLRTACGVILLLLFLQGYRTLADDMPGSLEMLGQGGTLFAQLVRALFVAIYLLVPAIASSAISHERERGSLELLLLTDMPPSSILLQKYVARMIPVLSCLAMALPLLAASLSLGGVEPAMVRDTAWLLLVTTLHVGAIALAVSTVAQSTGQAFVGTYVALIGGYMGGSWLLGRSSLDVIGAMAVPPLAFEELMARTGADRDVMVDGTVGLMLCTLVPLLLIARLMLTRSLHGRRGSKLLGFFRRVDSTMRRLNRYVGDVTIGDDRDTLPGDEPITWREEQRRALGRPEYALRFLVVTELTTLALCYALQGNPGALARLWLLVWSLAAMVLVVAGVSQIGVERSGKTLDLLLVSPLTGEQIVTQKVHGLYRLAMVLAVPLITISMSFSSHDFAGRKDHLFTTGTHLVLTLLFAVIYLRLAAWFGVHVGLRVKNRLRGTLIALIGLGVVVGLPPRILSFLQLEPSLIQVFGLLNPAQMLEQVVTHATFSQVVALDDETLMLVAANFWGWFMVLMFVARETQGEADMLLQRPA